MSSIILLSLVVSLIVAVPVVRADGWDDFTNNLATDLTPLLSLFGEQVTKQYMSESLTWVDNFIFAMAPLGILTAVVSVIRVCGGSSLRAFIGRAQEGRGAAEAELCSSTSSDVCELWNNGGIVRHFGRPKILELVHDKNDSTFYDTMDGDRKIHRPTTGLSSFPDYLRAKSDDAEWEEVGPMRPKKIESATMDFAPNPNLSLNVGIKKQPRRVYQAAALLGFWLQAGVLVFASVAMYILHYKKNDRPMRPWSFPPTFTGTVLLCLGMFSCAYLVERSTEERVFRLKKSSKSQTLMYWLQPGGQVVGDQTFDAFAYRNCPTEYTTSWKLEQSGSDPAIEIKVWFAVGITMSGFVLQFVGLRGMHSSISILQLGAILTMAVVRASLRSQRLDENDLKHLRDLVEGHELDWFAIQLEKDYVQRPAAWSKAPKGESNGSWKVSGSTVSKKWTRNSNDSKVWVSCDKTAPGGEAIILGGILGHESEKVFEVGVAWVAQLEQEQQNSREPVDKIGTGIVKRELTEYSGISGLSEGLQHQSRPNLGARIMRYRARLARLTGPEVTIPARRWQIESRRQAGMLRRAIEEVAKIVFSGDTTLYGGWQNATTIIWAIHCSVQQPNISMTGKSSARSAEQPIYLTLRRDEAAVDGSWKIDESELEAVVGLWLWSLDSEAEAQWDEYANANQRGLEVVLKRIFAISAIDEETEKAEMDFELWARRETSHDKDPLPKGPLQRCSSILKNGGTKSRYFGWQAVGLNAHSSMPPQMLSVTASNSLCTMCAQDVFISFMTAVTAIIDTVGGETNARDPTMEAYLKDAPRHEDLHHFLLLNSQIDRIANAFVGSGLGSRQDAYMCIIPSLRMHSKLPSVQAAHDNARISATTLRRENRWREAEKLLRWIYGSCDESDAGQLERTEVDLGEFYRLAMRDRGMDIVRLGFDGIIWMLNRPRKGLELTPKAITARYAWIATRIAAEMGDERIAQRLVGAGADRHMVKFDDNSTTLLQAIRSGNIAVGLLLLGRNGDDLSEIDEDGRAPLSWAATIGCLEITRSLLEFNVEPDPRDQLGRTPLSYAAESGSAEIARLLIGNGAFPNSKDGTGRTALTWAAAMGNESVVRFLLTTDRVTVDSRDIHGKTALIRAAESGHEAVVKLLLGQRADVDAEALHVAAGAGHGAVVKLLLEKGANIDATTTERATALHLASEGGHGALVRMLLESKARLEFQDAEDQTALLRAAANGHSAVIQVLLGEGASTEVRDKSGRTALSWAATNGHVAVVRQLIEAGSRVEIEDVDSRTALIWAAANGHGEVVRQLLVAGANIGTKDGEGFPIHWSAGNGHEGVIQVLLDAGADVETRDPEGRTPLHWAASSGHGAVAELLLERGTNVNAVTKGGSTALHGAAENGKDAMVGLLLTSGARVDPVDDLGVTPLHPASWKGHTAVVELLLSAGSSMEVKMKDINWAGDRSRGTPMHWAAVDGKTDVLALLLDGGAAIEARNAYHRTPLHLAARMGHPESAVFLVKRGADKEARRDTNETPLHFAVEENHHDIAKMLLDSGALIEAQGDRGTPLHFAAALGHTTAADQLLSEGADKDAIMHNGQTPLHRAAAGGHDDLVALLLKKRVRTDVRDRGGRTALDIARAGKYRRIVELLGGGGS
ncbi:MAG: hypothetical protein M1813_007500 [Trichoglossum hirsutum]|nr:MAG: hypothetical protein M1813_007500 [Trichoglossum hirsutum]